MGNQLFVSSGLTAICGCVWALLLLAVYAGHPLTEQDELRAYIGGWVFVPAFGLVFAYVFERLHRRWFVDNRRFYPIITIGNAAGLTVLIWLLRLDVISLPVALVCCPVLNGLLVLSLRQIGVPGDAGEAWEQFYPLFPFLFCAILPALLVDKFSWIAQRLAGKASPLLLIVGGVVALGVLGAIGYAAARLPRRISFKGGAGFRRAAAIVIPLLLVALILDVKFHFDPVHHGLYLGPVNDVLHGRTLLVDANCLYGVGVIYALAGICAAGLLPANYQGLSLALSIFTILLYTGWYFALRKVLRSQSMAILGLAAIVMANWFYQQDYGTWYPSAGVLRFGLPQLLLIVAAFRLGPNGGRRGWSIAEYAVLAVSAIWSIETFAYCAVTFAAVVLCQAVASSGSVMAAIRSVTRRALIALGAIAAAHLGLYLFTLARSGVAPGWGEYLEQLGLYGYAFYGYPLFAWSPWWIVPMVYLASLIAIIQLLRAGRPSSERRYLPFVAGVIALGAVTFTYFIGRSFLNNILHVCVPAFVLMAYWMDRLLSKPGAVPAALRFSVLNVGFCALILVVLGGLPTVYRKADATALYLFRDGRVAERLWHPAPTIPQIADAAALVEKYAPGKPRVVMLPDSNNVIEPLLLTGRINAFPTSVPWLEGLMASARKRILTSPDGLKEGDVVFFGADSLQLCPMERELLRGLRAKFRFEELERTANGVVAARLMGSGL